MTLRQFITSKLSKKQKIRVTRFLMFWRKHPCRLDLGCEPDHKILIGTHHKAGTVWLNSVFQAICKCHGLKYYYDKQRELPPGYDVFMQDHSDFDFDCLEDSFRGIHIIRDPRDVVISGCFYHQKSSEPQLHRPREEFGGLTYQEKLNSFENVDDQILFEMEHSSGVNIGNMLKWDYSRPEFFEVKYEDLIKDVDLKLFHEIFSFLGFGGGVIPSLLAIAYNKSLFSGQVKRSAHVRSGQGGQWKNYFKQVHKDKFVELFGDALIRLGYEKDNKWAQAEG